MKFHSDGWRRRECDGRCYDLAEVNLARREARTPTRIHRLPKLDIANVLLALSLMRTTNPGLVDRRDGLVASSTDRSQYVVPRVLAVLVIVIALARLVAVVPAWYARRPEAYPHQYAHLLYFTFSIVPLLGTTLLGPAARSGGLRRRPLYWVLLVTSLVFFALEMRIG
jgi:hypothetical protein